MAERTSALRTGVQIQTAQQQAVASECEKENEQLSTLSAVFNGFNSAAREALQGVRRRRWGAEHSAYLRRGVA